MNLIGFGLNHKSASFALLERVSFSDDAMDAFLENLRSDGHIHEAFGLSTCNRTEFLLSADDIQQALDTLLTALHDAKGVDLRAEADTNYFHTGEAAVRHLFRVACGLDSLVVGENEILGQLRQARERASDAAHTAETLDPLLLKALDVGRRARQTTAISRGNVSVASVAATLATRLIGDLSDKSGVVLGAGETAETAAFQLKERGLRNLTIINRTPERAHTLAEVLGAREAALTDIGMVLAQADIVVCATSAPHYMLTSPMLEGAMAVRPQRPLLLLDVSVPRNIDPVVADQAGVHLYSLENLAQLAEENRRQRENQVNAVENLIDQEMIATRLIPGTRESEKLIAELHRRIEQLRRDHLGRYSHQFSPADLDQVDVYTASLLRNVFHDLVENLKALDLSTAEGKQSLKLAQSLFNVNLVGK